MLQKGETTLSDMLMIFARITPNAYTFAKFVVLKHQGPWRSYVHFIQVENVLFRDILINHLSSSDVLMDLRNLMSKYHANGPFGAWRLRKWPTLEIFTSYSKVQFVLTRVYCESLCKTTLFDLLDEVQ